MFYTRTQTHLSQIGLAQHLQNILVTSHQTSVIDNSLIERTKMVRAISMEKGISIPVLGVNPLFEHVKLVTRIKPNWAFYNLSHDPLWKSGNFPIPRQYKQRLNILYRAGIEFDALYVAHELPIDFDHNNDKLELDLIEPEAPETMLRLAQNFGVVTDGIVSIYAATIRKSIQALAVVSNHRAVILRDPILVGTVIPHGVNPEEGVPAVWFLLAAWRW